MNPGVWGISLLRTHADNRVVSALRLSSAPDEQLVREHLPLVGYLVSELASRIPRHVSRDDLVSAGNAALVAAARSFDPGRGSFAAYARPRIRGALLDELRAIDWASRSVRGQVRRRDEAVDALTGQLGRPPTRPEVAARLGVAVRELDSLDDDVHRSVVLSYQYLTELQDPAADPRDPSPTPEQVLLERERRAYLMSAVEALPERLRRVVVGYFFEGLAMAELADELGVSESRVSQMRTQAFALIREGMASQLDREALPSQPRPNGVVARRKAAYYAAVAARSDYRTRLTAAHPAR